MKELRDWCRRPGARWVHWIEAVVLLLTFQFLLFQYQTIQGLVNFAGTRDPKIKEIEKLQPLDNQVGEIAKQVKDLAVRLEGLSHDLAEMKAGR